MTNSLFFKKKKVSQTIMCVPMVLLWPPLLVCVRNVLLHWQNIGGGPIKTSKTIEVTMLLNTVVLYSGV